MGIINFLKKHFTLVFEEPGYFLLSVLLLVCYLYLIKVLVSYLKNKKNLREFLDNLDTNNKQLKEVKNNIKTSFWLSKIIIIILIIGAFFLSRGIIITIDSYYEGYLIEYFYITYYPISVISSILLLLIITISVYLYYRCDKEYFKEYKNLGIKILILNIILHIISAIMYFKTLVYDMHL